MKVKELKELLAKVNDDFDVIMSKDGEGNDFSPLAEHTTAQYVPQTTWNGYLAAEDADDDGTRTIITENAIVLWPTN